MLWPFVWTGSLAFFVTGAASTGSHVHSKKHCNIFREMLCFNYLKSYLRRLFSVCNISIAEFLIPSHHERTNLMNKQHDSANLSIELAHKLWDEIFKSIVRHMPEQLFPLFKLVFEKEYPKDASVELLSTEYPVPGKSDSGQPAQISSIFADIVLRIAGADIYHLECQMEKEDRISVRMYEYDVNISLLYGRKEDEKAQGLRFPASIILYLGTNGTVPDKECCRIVMPDNSEITYTVPVIKVQNYSLLKIKENHLTIFLPYTFLRFRPRLRTKKKKVTRKELTMFVKEVIIILKSELSEGNITQWQYNDYIHYVWMAMEQVFVHYPKLYREVMNMTLTDFYMEIDVDRLLSKRLRKRITNQIKPGLIKEIKAELIDGVREEVEVGMRDEIAEKVRNEVTAKVRDEVKEEVRNEVTAKVRDEVKEEVRNEVTDEWSRKLADVQSENEKLRALLRIHGIEESSLTT